MSAPHVDQGTAAPRSVRQVSRPHDDRMVAGVASGLARYLGVDPVIIRLVFVVLALAGGGGVLAYVIAWIVIPAGPVDDEAPVTTHVAGGTSVVAGLVLVAIGGVLLVERLVPAFSWRYVGPALLVAIGVLLLARKA